MKVKSTFAIMPFAVLALSGLQTVNAQRAWNLASNNNATASSKSGITNAAPLKLTTNNRTRVLLTLQAKLASELLHRYLL